MAGNIFGTNAEYSSKRPRGRPLAIDDGRLWGVRDYLVWLVEVTWADVGVKLSKIKTPAQVFDALQVWQEQNRHNLHYVSQTLLRPSASPATAKLLNERRRQLGELNETVRNAYEFLGKCWESLELAMHLPGMHLSQG